MNGPFNQVQPTACWPMPAEFEALAPAPLLLPGESLQRYHLMRQTILAELAPRTAVEWLLAIDVVELSWEIQRYRRLRHKLLESCRQRAIEQTLIHIDLAGIPAEFEEEAKQHIRCNARIWRIDAQAAYEIEARLLAHGFSNDEIDLEVYLQGREMLLAFEALITSALNRRISVLREMDRGRISRRVGRMRIA